IVGLIKPNEGHVYLDGQEITEDPMYRRAQKGIGYLAQEASVFRKLSVENNIMAVLEIHYKDKALRQEKLEALLAGFSLNRLLKNPCVLLSRGVRRRTEFARALVANPPFILINEPFAGVDPNAVEEVRTI